MTNMTNLTDAQAALLAAAAAAPDGAIDREGDPRTIASLIKKGCLIALPQGDGLGRLLITAAGRGALRADDAGEQTTATISDGAVPEPEVGVGDEIEQPQDPQMGAGTDQDDGQRDAGEPRELDAPATALATAKPLPKGKVGALIALLRQPTGATVEAMMEATGWQAHSVRGAMSGAIKKNLGLEVTSDKTDAGRVYRIKSETPA
jgi:Protein of unknown function (DUF3489)